MIESGHSRIELHTGYPGETFDRGGAVVGFAGGQALGVGEDFDQRLLQVPYRLPQPLLLTLLRFQISHTPPLTLILLRHLLRHTRQEHNVYPPMLLIIRMPIKRIPRHRHAPLIHIIQTIQMLLHIIQFLLPAIVTLIKRVELIIIFLRTYVH